MTKQKQDNQIAYDHKRGEIKESAVKALVSDPLFRCRVERNKKGKGSYQRKAKHKKDHYSGGLFVIGCF